MIVRLSPHQHTTTMAEVCYLLADDALKSGYNKYVCCIKYTLELWILLHSLRFKLKPLSGCHTGF